MRPNLKLWKLITIAYTIIWMKKSWPMLFYLMTASILQGKYIPL